MELKKLIGLRIKELRKKKQLSQEQVTAYADITTSHLSNIESGKENPTLDTFLKLASAFDIKLNELFDFGHLLKKKELQQIIKDTANKASEDELRLIVKFINTLEK